MPIQRCGIVRRSSYAVLLTLASLLPAPAARATGVSVALSASHVTVEPDSTFNLELDVSSAGSAFNSFAAVIGYDPAALTFLPRSPVTAQQGCLMTGTCSAACGTTFHQFSAAGDSLLIYDSLLCDSVSLAGPGQLYTLQFRAAHAQQTTWVRVRRITFYRAGVFVTPVSSTDAQVTILRTAAVGPQVATSGLRLGALPNPSRGALSFTIASDAPGEQLLEVLDLSGRQVRRLDGAWHAPGAHTLAWDGRGAAGERLPAGVYLARVTSAGRMALARIVLLH